MAAMWFKVPARWFNEVRSFDRTFGYDGDVYARRWKGAWVFTTADPLPGQYELLDDDEAQRVVDKDAITDNATAAALDWHFDYTLGPIVPRERRAAWRGGGGYRRKSMLHWNLAAREVKEREAATGREAAATLKPIVGREIRPFV